MASVACARKYGSCSRDAATAAKSAVQNYSGTVFVTLVAVTVTAAESV